MYRDMMRFLFEPRSVALIGATDKRGKVGYAIAENLLKFPGSVYFVNIKCEDGSELLGKPCYKSIKNIPEEIDLAVIAVPAKFVPSVVKECVEKGVKAIIIISAGFKEVGPEGAKLEAEILKIVEGKDIAILGPNCLGVYVPKTKLDTIFNPPDRQDKPKEGGIAFISQSGAFGAAFMDRMASLNIGLSKFISYGNAMQIDESDLIEFLNEDPDTKVITAYIEGVKDGRKFAEVLKKLKKPLVVFKAGITSAGAKAASSHTGSLAGTAEIYKGVFRQYRIVDVFDMQELLDAAIALERQPAMGGDRVAIVTNGGGAGVMTSDYVVLHGMRLAEISEETKKKLKEKLPPAASVHNPIDVLGDAPVERYAVALEAMIEEENVDAIILISLMQSPAVEFERFYEMVIEKAKEANARGKPLVVILPGGRVPTEYVKKFIDAGIPAYITPLQAVKALRALRLRGERA